MTTSENDELGARSASWFLLGRRDAYYLLSLLIPFFVYNLALKAVSVASIPGLALTFDLVRSDVFFHLGYALLFFGLFAVARGRRRFLHRVVVILFHASVMIEVVATTGTYLYLQQTETALDWDAIAGEIPPRRSARSRRSSPTTSRSRPGRSSRPPSCTRLWGPSS